MTILTQNLFRAGHYLISEAENSYRSRDQGVIASGAGALKAGTVLSNVRTAVAAAVAGGNTGDGTFVLDAATPVLTGAKDGVYTLRFTSTTSIRLQDVKGRVLADIAIVSAQDETADVAEQIMGMVTQGATPFAAGDGFDITVAKGKYQAYDGSLSAEAILFEGCDASSADVRRTLTTRDAEVHADVLQWADGVTDPQKTAALADLAAFGIIGR